MRVLVIEDDPTLLAAITQALRRAHMVVDGVSDGSDALVMLEGDHYDVAVVDRDIPGVSGDGVVASLRARSSPIRILMLTAAATPGDRIVGLELGSDDYLTKPFTLRELILRINALGRRGPVEREILEAGGLRVEPRTRKVWRDGAPIALTNKQFTVLEILVQDPGAIVSAEELLARAWDENANPFTNSIRVTISQLRKRLGEPWLVQTVPGAGYRIADDDA